MSQEAKKGKPVTQEKQSEKQDKVSQNQENKEPLKTEDDQNKNQKAQPTAAVAATVNPIEKAIDDDKNCLGFNLRKQCYIFLVFSLLTAALIFSLSLYFLIYINQAIGEHNPYPDNSNYMMVVPSALEKLYSCLLVLVLTGLVDIIGEALCFIGIYKMRPLMLIGTAALFLIVTLIYTGTLIATGVVHLDINWTWSGAILTCFGISVLLNNAYIIYKYYKLYIAMKMGSK